jgi:membrane protease YdiL (CAAX protease family)
MTIPQESLAAAPERLPGETAAQSESARSLILAAVGWWVLAELTGAPVGFVTAMMKTAGIPNASVNNPISFTVMVFLASGVLLIGVRKRSAIVGHGNRRAGVGDQPIKRWWLLIVLALLAAMWSFFAAAVWNGLAPEWLASWRQASPWTMAAFAVATVVLAPFAEELFFRGWLWTALRRHWRTFPTALLTCGFWSLIHLERGLALPLILLPTAIMLGFARQFRGIRAAIILHATYNLVGVLVLLLLLGSKG